MSQNSNKCPTEVTDPKMFVCLFGLTAKTRDPIMFFFSASTDYH